MPKPIVRFALREGSPFSQADAAIIGPEIFRLAKLHGEATSDIVVQEVETNAQSPLRPYFEWNKTKAARMHWKKQASDMIGAVEIIYIRKVGDTEVEERIRGLHYVVKTVPSEKAKVHMEDEEEEENTQPRRRRVAIPLGEVVADQNYIDQVINNALLQLKTWKARYQQYQTVLPGFAQKFKKVFAALQNL